MATLVLGAIGTLVGGPVGGAIGALAGRQIDAHILGPGSREGPRLKDLAVTTSSYGTPIPRHFGTMRAAGTIIWSTDLKENSEASGGGKGKPQTTSYSYTISFAVALSSRPIVHVGRIWADGNLLRGAAGDLKAGGAMRLHLGSGDQPVDPLLAAAQGTACPAFRGLAYVVFEDLDLSDFGNRIPALTFEIHADEGPVLLSDIMAPLKTLHKAEVNLQGLVGFSDEGGPLQSTLATISSVYPLASDAGGGTLTVSSSAHTSAQAIMLPEAASAWEDGGFGGATGQSRSRSNQVDTGPTALRYYDLDRDFQPGVQRADGRAKSGQSRIIEFPGALTANAARALANAAAQRSNAVQETLAWRLAELDPSIAPGTAVQAPSIPGIWQVAGWEWRERGVELELVRLPSAGANTAAGDPGILRAPQDYLAAPTVLRAFELPWDGRGSSDAQAQYTAVSSFGDGWSGAALYIENAGQLDPVGSTRTRSVTGSTLTSLAPSRAFLLERNATLAIELAPQSAELVQASPAMLATGANRLLVGDEVVQFAIAEKISPTQWKLQGLLRGRGGTEGVAGIGHPAGSAATIIDASLFLLDPAKVSSAATTVIAAIGRGDASPALATLENPGHRQTPTFASSPAPWDNA